jgi:anti-anti-sigma regulatory factor
MSTTTTIQAHIAYELIDDHNPDVVVIEFRSQEIAGPVQARELGEQLDSLIRPDLPRNFVIDFGNVRSLGSTAFGEIVSFAHKVGRLSVFNMQENLRLGAALIGLDDCAEFAANRRLAINEARRAAMHDEDDTVDYPASWVESNEAAYHASRSA